MKQIANIILVCLLWCGTLVCLGAEQMLAQEEETAVSAEGYPDPGIPPMYDGEEPPKPNRLWYVCDWGELLTPEHRGLVHAIGQKLNELTTAELVLVTVPTRYEIPIMDFSYNLANGWGIGKAGKDNGCLLLGVADKLLANESGKIRIEVGRGLQGCLNDAKCGRVLDELALPPFLAADESSFEEQSAALVQAYIYLAQEIAKEAGVSLDLDVPEVELPEEEISADDVGRWGAWGVMLAIVLLAIYGSKSSKTSGSSRSSGSDSSSDSNDSYDSSDSDSDSDYGGGSFDGGGADR